MMQMPPGSHMISSVPFIAKLGDDGGGEKRIQGRLRGRLTEGGFPGRAACIVNKQQARQVRRMRRGQSQGRQDWEEEKHTTRLVAGRTSNSRTSWTWACLAGWRRWLSGVFEEVFVTVMWCSWRRLPDSVTPADNHSHRGERERERVLLQCRPKVRMKQQIVF